MVLIREGQEAADPDVTPHEVGTTAEIAGVTPLPAGRYYVSTTGGRRFRIAEIVSREPFLVAEVAFIDDDAAADPDDAEPRAAELTERVKGEFREYARLLVAFSGSDGRARHPQRPGRRELRRRRRAAGRRRAQAAPARAAHAPRPGCWPSWASCAGCCRSCARCSSASRRSAKVVRDDAPGGEFRTHQEQFFGKHFSLN